MSKLKNITIFTGTNDILNPDVYVLKEKAEKSNIEINIKDADNLGIKNWDRSKVTSRRGEIETTARVGYKVSKGESWMPFHFPDGNANWLTNAALDKFAKAPEYKVCAIKIAKA